MMYDCIIVGGGPAGSVCGLILQNNGLRCLLLEKRPVIDEKICGGFIPDRCRNLFLTCGIDLADMTPAGHRISGYIQSRDGKTETYTYREGRYGLGVFRKDLDSFLLGQARLAGVEVRLGEQVLRYRKEDGLYLVNGRRGRTVVWAAGARAMAAEAAFGGMNDRIRESGRGQSMGISEIVQTDRCGLAGDMVHFWYAGSGPYDYFWAIPIGTETWNIGYWSQKERRHLKECFVRGRERWMKSACRNMRTVRAPRGALLGNTDYTPFLAEEGFFCCGDLAGANHDTTGEGIAQAVLSAGTAAARVTRALLRTDGGKEEC